MQINVYHKPKHEVIGMCINVTQQMNYRIHSLYPGLGAISAMVVTSDAPASPLLDIRINQSNDYLSVNVFANSFSNSSGIIFHDAENETRFLELFYQQLLKQKIQDQHIEAQPHYKLAG